MDAVVRAVEAFLGHLTAIHWGALGLAVVCHLLKIGARTRSWRNILAAAYPGARVRWRSVFGAYAAGVGVNAVLPARAGDVLKLYLVKQRIEGAAYPTLAATLVVETLFDVVVSSALVAWAVWAGVLPGLDVLPRLPDVDWLWLFHHPQVALPVLGAVVAVALALAVLAARRVAAFRRRVAQGFAVLDPPGRYLRVVVPWQALDWCLRLLTVFFLLHAFGIPATAYNALAVQVTQGLSTALPLTPAGIGTEQALLAYVFRDVAPTSQVLAFSVGMKLVLIAVNVALAALAIGVMMRTLRWRRAVGRARRAAAAGVPDASQPTAPS